MQHVHSAEAGEEQPATLVNYDLLLSFRAVIIILDQLAPHVKEDYNYTKSSVFIDREARRQNVLLVLTGDDQGLSAPASFDSIRSQSLPLERDDMSMMTRALIWSGSLCKSQYDSFRIWSKEKKERFKTYVTVLSVRRLAFRLIMPRLKQSVMPMR